MNDRDLFALALGLTKPWFVSSVELDADQKKLELSIDFERGSEFPCPECGAAGCKAYDTEQRRWRHLNFFQYETHLNARMPRVRCGNCGMRPVAAPWARPGSGFTLLFEALILTLAAHMPVRAAARLVGEHDTRIWRLLHHYVDQARRARDDREVKEVGIDETASRRRFHYVSLFVDLEQARVLYVAEGNKASTVREFREDLEGHGGDPERVAEICCDMSPAFISGVEAAFPQAAITFDKFHVLQLLGNAVDKTRKAREERASGAQRLALRIAAQSGDDERPGARLRCLAAAVEHCKNRPGVPSPAGVSRLLRATPEGGRALPDPLVHLGHTKPDTRHDRRSTLDPTALGWCPPLVRVAHHQRLARRHHSLVQAAKAKARGYRSFRNLATIIYLIAGKLDLQPTHLR